MSNAITMSMSGVAPAISGVEEEKRADKHSAHEMYVETAEQIKNVNEQTAEARALREADVAST
jgi:hypothetical protein